MRPPLPPVYPTLKVHDLNTPPLSPTTSSVASTSSPVTPIYPYTPTLVGDRAASESLFESRFGLLRNSSEVWEVSKDADYDPSSVTVADPGILISPSSSLLSGLDLLGGTTLPPSEVTDVPKRTRSHRMSIPLNESFLDFPSPPTLVPSWGPSFGESRLIGERPLRVSPLSNPALAASCECIPQSSRCSQFSTSQRRWSALPPAEFHLDSRRGSSEFVPTKGTGTVRGMMTERPDLHLDTPTLPRKSFFATSHAGPGDGFYDKLPHHRPQRQKGDPEPFTSFIDMSTKESTLSKSRVHKLFSKISGGLKPRSKRRY